MLHLHKLHAGEVPTYLEDAFVGQFPGRFWAGRLVSEVDLPPEPDAESVQWLLESRHMGRRHLGGGSSALTAVQMTLSAPKGVSIAALVYGDTRILVAHQNAVLEALTYCVDLLVCRVTLNKVTIPVPSKGALYAAFHRYQSRGGDPHLHTNAILFNSGKVDDGKWRAIDPRMLWEEKHFIGAIYRSALMQSLIGLGYRAAMRDDGLFDIDDIDESISDMFSGRRDEISERIEKVTKGPVADLRQPSTVPFAVATAPHTEHVQHSLREKQWLDHAGSTGFTFARPEANANKSPIEPGFDLELVIAEAYQELRGSKGGVQLSDLLLHCYQDLRGRHGVAELLATLEEMVTVGYYNIDGTPRTLFTDDDYIEFMERKGINGPRLTESSTTFSPENM